MSKHTKGRVSRLGTAACACFLAALAFPGPVVAAPGEIVEFATPTEESRPYGMAAGPDGNMWFTENWPEAHRIGRITTDGQITEFPLASAANLDSITPGPDGNMWFTDGMSDVGRITTDGQITEFPVPSGVSMRQTRGIVLGPDGNLWFRMVYPDAIAKITPTGQVTEYQLPHGAGHPIQLAVGPDGNLWFTLFEPDAIGRITTDGQITEFPLGTENATPYGIAAGADGNMWFTIRGEDKIGRITTDGQITEFPLQGDERGAEEIVSGPEGNLWFTEAGPGRIGRITLDGKVGEYLIPTGDSVPLGIAAGPEGNLWFAEWLGNRLARLTPGPPVPQNVRPPTISGSTVEGHTLSAWAGSWTNEPTGYDYQWEDCDSEGASCSPIAAATAAGYVLTAEDVNHTLRVKVSATNSEGTSEPATSAATSAVVPAASGSPPVIESESVSHITPTDATLEATINTEGLETTYLFELDSGCLPPMACPTTTIYTLPTGTLLGSFLGQSVSLELNSVGIALNPGIEYAYSVSATNAAGTQNGPERRFITPSEGEVEPPSDAGTQSPVQHQSTSPDSRSLMRRPCQLRHRHPARRPSRDAIDHAGRGAAEKNGHVTRPLCKAQPGSKRHAPPP